MSDMLKSFVKKELEEQIKNKYSHIKYPAGMYAKVVQVIKKNDALEYVLRILDKNLNEDSSFAEIPGVRTELELNKGDIAVILLLYGGSQVWVIGNYGICRQDMESLKPWPDGYIVRELSRIPSNFRCEDTIQNFLEENDIPGICGIDTRALTKLLREKGTMNGMITTKEYSDLSEPISRMKAYTVAGVVMATTTKEKYVLPGNGKKVALMDFGAKKNIARSLNERGCEVTVYPADTPAEEVLAANPDGIMLSNGPGDPKENVEIIKEIKKMYDSNVPIFAICLGHQLMALANGMDTYKLKYGHRGGNHPVKDLETGRVYISSQNHGYAVDTNTVKPEIAVPAFVNVNDGTNEGLKYTGKNIFTVQYHPEACPGPQDSGYLFDRFLKMMEVND